MSTNYYLQPLGACDRRCSSWVHLGQARVGSRFLFQGYVADPHGYVGDIPDHVRETVGKVETFQEWKELASYGQVRDEYGRGIELDELLDDIEATRKDRSRMTDLSPPEFRWDGEHEFLMGEFS